MFGAPGTRLQRLPGAALARTPREVQYASGVSTTTVSVTLGRSPTPGNLLVCLLSGPMAGGDFNYPTGFSKVDGHVADATSSLALAVRRCQVGDGTTFTSVVRNTNAGMAIIEIADARNDVGETFVVNASAPASSPILVGVTQVPQQECATGLFYNVLNLSGTPTTIAPLSGYTMRSVLPPTNNPMYIFKRNARIVPNDPTNWTNTFYSVTGQPSQGIVATLDIRGVVY